MIKQTACNGYTSISSTDQRSSRIVSLPRLSPLQWNGGRFTTGWVYFQRPNLTKAYQGACTKAGGWSHIGTHINVK